MKSDAHYPTLPSLKSLGLPSRARTPMPATLRSPGQSLASLGLGHPARTPPPASLRSRVNEVRPVESEAQGAALGSRKAKQLRSNYAATITERGTFARLEGQARLDAAVPCLRQALFLLCRRDGWCQGATHDAAGRVSLNGALQAGGTALEAYFAREVLRRVATEHDFTAFNDHPLRRRSDVVRLVRAALTLCTKHLPRGGWSVSR